MNIVFTPVWCFILGVALVVVFRILFPKRPWMLPPPQQQRRLIGNGDLASGARVCKACGAQEAGYATYCGNCGRQL